VDFNNRPTVSHLEDVNTVGKVDLDLYRVAGLVVVDFDLALTDAPFLRGHAGLDTFLIPGVDPDVGIGGFDPQLGSATDGEGLRPFLGVC
jgi:hypothetical protein